MTPIATSRAFLGVEALAFTIASMVHAGYLARGYAHRNAHIAETIIAIVLAAGLVATWAAPSHWRRASTWAQGFALVATLVGIATIGIGVGPRTVPDVIYHIAMVILLAWGLAVVRRAPAPPGSVRR
jgi:hypothetical protein